MNEFRHQLAVIRDMSIIDFNDGALVALRENDGGRIGSSIIDIGGCNASGQTRCSKLGTRGHSRTMAAARPQHMQRVFIRSKISRLWLILCTPRSRGVPSSALRFCISAGGYNQIASAPRWRARKILQKTAADRGEYRQAGASTTLSVAYRQVGFSHCR
jgi:hypothetical protein